MLEILRSTPLFGRFSTEALTALVPLIVEERHPAGEVLFREGEPGRSFFVLVTGQVEIQKQGRTLTVLSDGALFGEMAAYLGKRTADARVRKDATIYRIDNDVFEKFLLSHPEESSRFLYQGIQEMAKRLARTSDYLITLFETGRIVGSDLDPSEMSRLILGKLLQRIEEASGGMILILNPFTESYEVAGEIDCSLLDAESALPFVAQKAERMSVPVGNGIVLRVPLGDGEKTLGFILLEKPAAAPFDDQQEVIALAVADQIGLGVLQAYHRQEERARQRLERNRGRRF